MPQLTVAEMGVIDGMVRSERKRPLDAWRALKTARQQIKVRGRKLRGALEGGCLQLHQWPYAQAQQGRDAWAARDTNAGRREEADAGAPSLDQERGG